MLDLSDLPVIDDHAHMFGPDAKDANPVRSFTMLEHPKDIEHQLLYQLYGYCHYNWDALAYHPWCNRIPLL